MSEHDRREDAPAPGHWRVTAQPMAAVQARPQAVAGSAADMPARTGGRPLIATAICVGVLLLWLLGRNPNPIEPGSGPAFYSGVVIGGALFSAIPWGIAYAITIRKASKRWKLGSLAVVAVLGGLVALTKVAPSGAAAPATPAPVFRTGK